MSIVDLWRWGMPEYRASGEVALFILLIGVGIIWVIIWTEGKQRKEAYLNAEN